MSTTRKIISLNRTSSGCYAQISIDNHSTVNISSKSGLEVCRTLKLLGFTIEDVLPISNNNDHNFVRNVLKNFTFGG